MTGFWRASSGRRYLSFAAVAALALLVAACGRKGDPLPPPDPSAPAAPKESSEPANGGLGAGRPANPPIARPDKPFLLDPLIK